MTSLGSAVALLAAIILFRQSWVLLRARPVTPEFTWLALLDLLLGSLGLVLSALSWTGNFVLAREFHAVMVSGVFGQAALSVLLVGFPLAGAIGWGTARAGVRRPSWVVPLATLGIAIGVWSVLLVTALNADAPFQMRVWAYEFWSPPLVVWMTLCMAEAGLTILGIDSWAVRVWVMAIVIALIAALVLTMANGVAMELRWQDIQRIALAVAMGCLVGRACRRGTASGNGSRPSRILLGSVRLAATGLIAVPLLVSQQYVVPLVLASHAVLAPVAAYRLLRSPATGRPVPSDRPLVVRLILLVCVMLIAASLLLPFTWQGLPPDLAPMLFIAAWIMLAEAIACGPLAKMCVWALSEGAGAIHSMAAAVKAAEVRALDRARRSIAVVASMNTVSLLVLQSVVAIGLVALLLELPNRGRLVIEPFSAEVLSNDKDLVPDTTLKTLGQSVSDRLVSQIHALEADLKPDVELLPMGHETRTGPLAMPIRGGGETGAVPEGTLDVLNVKIPFDFMLTPIRPYLQQLFGVTLVNGSVQLDEDHYALLATSNTGDAWVVSRKTKTPSDPPGTSSKRPGPAASAAVAMSHVETIGTLAEKLAFDIAVSNPPAHRNVSTITTSREAFGLFRKGLEHWRRFEVDKHYGSALTDATGFFRKATEQDPLFALAHYRLGLALRAGADPARASDEFRKSVDLSPRFIAGHLALAATLYDFEVYTLPPVAISSDRTPPPATRVARRREAERSWQSISSLPFATASDRGAAYYGLCRRSLDSASEPDPRIRYSCQWSPPTCAAYYFCVRARRLYAPTSATKMDGPTDTDRGIRAAILGTLGDVIRRGGAHRIESAAAVDGGKGAGSDGEASKGHDTGISRPGCGRGRSDSGSDSARLALPFYRAAFELTPENSKDRRALWIAAEEAGDDGTLRRLAVEPRTHLSVADLYLDRADQVSGHGPWSDVLSRGDEKPNRGEARCYRLALKEYERAIRQDPFNLIGLNNYAYAFWRWRVWHPRDVRGWQVRVGRRAKRYATDAVKLARGRATNYETVIYRDTLGEVLLGLGRPQRALPILRSAERLATSRGYDDRAYSDEVRWDLAVAYVCASGADKKRAGSQENEAASLLNRVRANQVSSDPAPLFAAEALDTPLLKRFCTGLQGSAAGLRDSPSRQDPGRR
jgi:tetratricopeptide (TPR) repeat protein